MRPKRENGGGVWVAEGERVCWRRSEKKTFDRMNGQKQSDVMLVMAE